MSPAGKIKGLRSGRLVARERGTAPYRDTRRVAWWWCDCDCGAEALVRADDLVSGNTKSCGCLRSESSSDRATKRGKSEP